MSDYQIKRRKLETLPKSSLVSSLVVRQGTTLLGEAEKEKSSYSSSGRTLLPNEDKSSWGPSSSAKSPEDGALTLELQNFNTRTAQNGTGNNTVVIQFEAPVASKRFSINIAGPNHDNFNSVLFHFNPRQFELGGQCVLNSKNKGTWGQAICIPMSTLPLIFGRPSYCKLSIQLSKAGFDIHLDNKHIARLEHRQEIRSGDCSLFLNFPATDDYGTPEKWTVSNVWWGAKPLIAKCNASEIAGCTSMNLLHPTKLFIRGLPKIHTSSQVDLRRAQLERAFRKYGGIRGVSVIAPKKVSFAFIELEFAEQAQAALREMAGHFNITHAKYTRLEALGAQKRASKAN